MHKKIRIRTLTVLTALIMSFIPVTVTDAATEQEATTTNETIDQETAAKKPKASASFKNKNLSFTKSKSKTAVLVVKNLKISKVKATLKNNKAAVKSIELNEKGATTTIKIQLVGKTIGKDKLTVDLTTDSGRKVTRRCNINMTAPKKQDTKKDTPKKDESKDDMVKFGDRYIPREMLEEFAETSKGEKSGYGVSDEED